MSAKVLIRTNADLAREGRWDLDYHLPPELIESYPAEQRTVVAALADVSKATRNPPGTPEETFRYVDIASVDIVSGTVTIAQELSGAEAPSRARMLIRAYDVVVSTVRPTRGASAVIPEELDGEVCSTGFTVLRCKPGVNPYYLHYVLRLPSTLEQLRKCSTGSSYPAILDTDVLKAVVPAASTDQQDALARATRHAYLERDRAVTKANAAFSDAMGRVEQALIDRSEDGFAAIADGDRELPVSRAAIDARLALLRAERDVDAAEDVAPRLPI